MKFSKQSNHIYFTTRRSLSTTWNRGMLIIFSRYQNKMRQQTLPIWRFCYIHSNNPKMINGLRFFSKFSYILPIHERKNTLIFIKFLHEKELIQSQYWKNPPNIHVIFSKKRHLFNSVKSKIGQKVLNTQESFKRNFFGREKPIK